MQLPSDDWTWANIIGWIWVGFGSILGSLSASIIFIFSTRSDIKVLKEETTDSRADRKLLHENIRLDIRLLKEQMLDSQADRKKIHEEIQLNTKASELTSLRDSQDPQLATLNSTLMNVILRLPDRAP